MNQIQSPGKNWLERGEDWLGRRCAGWLLLALLAGIYTAAYLRHPLYPDGAPAELRQGWWSWFDQFAYWKSAAELAQFQISPGGYHYPLGYPLLGALFWRLMPNHAFFLPDLLLVLGAAVVWWRLARGGLSRVQALLVGGLFIAAHANLLALTQIVPWNTIATQLTLMAGMWVMVATQGPATVWRLAVLAAATYLVRPGDAACFAPMLIWAVLRLPDWRARASCAVGGVMIIGTAVVAVGLLNLTVFREWVSPYERVSWASIGFFAYPIGAKLYWLFVDGRPFFGETGTALLFRYPWLPLALPGAVHWVRREGMAAVAALASLGLSWALYANYNDFMPSGVFRYSLIHYISWGFAPLFALAAAAVLHGWRQPEDFTLRRVKSSPCQADFVGAGRDAVVPPVRADGYFGRFMSKIMKYPGQRATQVGFVLAPALAIFALGIQLNERELPVAVTPGRVDRLPVERPVWVRFPGVPLEQVTKLRLDGRTIQENSDYQIPYVPSDLCLLLSSRPQGVSLAATDEAGITVTPVVGDFVWGWRIDSGRLFPNGK